MKATLTYNLDNPDDKMAHLRAIKSLDMAIILHELEYNLHKRIERQLEVESKQYTDMEVVQMYRDEITELIKENNINIDELIN
jgi:hypothetical protein